MIKQKDIAYIDGKPVIVESDYPENWYELRMMFHAELDAEVEEAYGPQTPEGIRDEIAKLLL